MAPDVRDRSREILRAELAEAAAAYCSQHGFDEVTVDEIARGIGISRATFFRYFGSKEDAVVLASRALKPDLSALGSPRRGRTALGDVRASMDAVVAAATADPQGIRDRIRMIGATPALRARLGFVRAEDRRALEAALLERVDDPVLARGVAGAAMAAIDLGWSLWAAEDAADLGVELDRAFAAVAGAAAVR